SRTLLSETESLTFPILSEPSSSDRTKPILSGGMDLDGETQALQGPIDSPPRFGETTLAMDPMSRLPVSPIPPTEPMSPGAFPMHGGFVHPGPVMRSAPPPPPPVNAAPTLRSSARGTLVLVAVFTVSA